MTESYYFLDRGRSIRDFRVLNKDMEVVLTTPDEAKARRRCEQIGGTIHPSYGELDGSCEERQD